MAGQGGARQIPVEWGEDGDHFISHSGLMSTER